MTRKNKDLVKGIFKITLPFYRIQHNLTCQQVADHLGIHRTTYLAWEIGKNCPDIWSLKLLAEFYNVTIEDLLDTSKINE